MADIGKERKRERQNGRYRKREKEGKRQRQNGRHRERGEEGKTEWQI